MAVETSRQTHHFPDGSVVELAVRTPEASVRRILEADLARRMRTVNTLFPLSETGLGAYAAFAPDGESEGHRSTTTHALPDGELTVRIDASRKGIHGYLHYLVTDAVAYVHVVSVEVRRASLLALLLLGLGAVLVATGHHFLSLPPFGAGGTIALHLLGYVLSARGVFDGVARDPVPNGPYR